MAAATRTTCRRGIWSTASPATLRAVAFDLERLEVVGTPAPVLEGVVTTAAGAADVAVAPTARSSTFQAWAGGGGRQTVVSVDRQGRASAAARPPAGLVPRRPSVARRHAARARHRRTMCGSTICRATTLSRLTTDPARTRSPLWTPDGQRIIFTSRRAGYPELFWRPADGTGRDERLLARAKDLLDLRANGWSADGRQLLFTEVPPQHSAERSGRSPSSARQTRRCW